MTKQEYFIDVMEAGNQKPWAKWGRLNHRTVIDPQNVELDPEGNIIRMPLLKEKPCFGRPETRLRHGELHRTVRNKWNKEVQTTTQCGRCPAATRMSCAKVVTHRIKADPNVHAALRAWMKECADSYGGALVYNGKGAGERWGDVKKAIAGRGPYKSFNDQLLEEEREREAICRVETWRRNKARQRAMHRLARQAAKQPPSKQYVENALSERARRQAQLEVALAVPNPSRRLSKVELNDRPRVAALTASAWFVRTVLLACGRRVGNTVIAGQLVAMGLNEEVVLDTLKNRVKNDLNRGIECERQGIWGAFDADSDLGDYSAPDDTAADGLEDPCSGDDFQRALADISVR